MWAGVECAEETCCTARHAAITDVSARYVRGLVCRPYNVHIHELGYLYARSINVYTHRLNGACCLRIGGLGTHLLEDLLHKLAHLW